MNIYKFEKVNGLIKITDNANVYFLPPNRLSYLGITNGDITIQFESLYKIHIDEEIDRVIIGSVTHEPDTKTADQLITLLASDVVFFLTNEVTQGTESLTYTLPFILS